MKQVVVVILFLLGNSIVFSQNEFRKDFEMTLQYGNASIEIEDSENVGFYTASNFKKEIGIGTRYSILTGVMLNSSTVNGSWNHVETKSVGIPLSFRSYFVGNDKSSLFAEFGTYGSYRYTSEFKNQEFNSSKKIKDSGYNFGGFFKLGYSVLFNEMFKVNLALVNGKDFGTSTKSEKPSINIDNQIGIEFGVGVNLFK